MHSSSLKVFTDFNTGRIGGGVADFEVGARRQWLICRDQARTCKIVACSSERNSGGSGNCGGGGAENQSLSSFISRSQNYALLKQQMEVAAKSEDYKEAARIRDSLRLFEAEEPVLHLRRLLRQAIAEERFEDAAMYRDELKEIAPHSLLKCSSDATTLMAFAAHTSTRPSGRKPPVCKHCNVVGHTKDRCFQLHPELKKQYASRSRNSGPTRFAAITEIRPEPLLLILVSFIRTKVCFNLSLDRFRVSLAPFFSSISQALLPQLPLLQDPTSKKVFGTGHEHDRLYFFGEPPPPPVSSSLQGIRVQVRSVYIEGRSQPSKSQYFFAYRIRITNNSDRPVQLLRRHWIITDGNGKTENIWGIGVIGEQPVILPNTGFEYSSACPLSTSSGRMEGDFEMKHIDKVGSRTFNVAIAPFSLSTFGDGTDAF